jgi:hypothetical protein
MKKITTTLLLLIIAIVSYSQTFRVYTAVSSGLWTLPANWASELRTDGVKKNKVVIPKNISIVADNDVNDLDLGNVEIYIFGNLTLLQGTNLNLSNGSSITLSKGSITGSAANQKIKIGSDIKYKGNTDGILSGDFKTDNTTGSSPNGFISFSMLPVNFTSFYISKSGQDIQLSWSTDKEINNSHFDVERSFNGTDWQKVSVVDGAGTSNNVNNYSYHDKNVTGSVVYYRLRQVDIDGGSLYSSIKSIRMSEAVSAVRIYGSNKNVVIDLNTSIKNNLVVSVVNANGQVISKQAVSNPSYRININVHNASTGTYIVHVTDNKGWTEVKKVIL